MTRKTNFDFTRVDTGYEVCFPEYHGEGNFNAVKDCAHRLDPESLFFCRYSPEKAAETFAEGWCDEAYCYSLLETEGIDVLVKDPEGHIHKVHVTGESRFDISAEVVEEDEEDEEEASHENP